MYSAQAVVMGEKVYVGGGATKKVVDFHLVFQYNTSQDEWSRLPPHSLIRFAMAQFSGYLITVGGEGAVGGVNITGKVYRFKEESQEWEEFLKPMPTARCACTVATTQSAIIATGGASGIRDGKAVASTAVEVYCSETSQWYTADPLPVACYNSLCITISGNCYILGTHVDGMVDNTVLYASLTSLVQKATSPTRKSANRTSVWKTLPDTPLKGSTAASLSGNLLAVGGWGEGKTTQAVHLFFPLSNSWVRIMTGDLPQPRYSCTAVQLSSNTMIVIGGKDKQNKRTKTVFLATVTV